MKAPLKVEHLPLDRPARRRDDRVFVAFSQHGVRFFVDHQSFDLAVPEPSWRRCGWYARMLVVALDRLGKGPVVRTVSGRAVPVVQVLHDELARLLRPGRRKRRA